MLVIDVAHCAFYDESGFGQPQVFEKLLVQTWGQLLVISAGLQTAQTRKQEVAPFHLDKDFLNGLSFTELFVFLFDLLS